MSKNIGKKNLYTYMERGSQIMLETSIFKEILYKHKNKYLF